VATEPKETPLPPTSADDGAVRAIVGAVRRGDREVFARLVELYQSRIFGLALMIVRDRSGAEEVSQDAFVRAFTKLEFYDERRPFYPWLATITVRLAQNWLTRSSRLKTREGVSLETASEPAASTDPLGNLISDESDRRLWRSVAALPEGERMVVILYYRQEMKVNDVARALGVTAGTVKTLLFRARRRLRGCVQDQIEQRGGESK